MLIPPVPVHLVHQLPPAPLPPDVRRQHLERPVCVRVAGTADMRRDQHVGRRPQRIVFRQRFRVCDIQRGAANLLFLQRVDKRLLVDDGAARDVGNVRPARVALVQEFEFIRGEKVGGVFAGGGE